MKQEHEVLLAEAMRHLPISLTSGLGALMGRREVLKDRKAGKAWVARFNKNAERLCGAHTDQAKREALIAYGRQAGRVYAEFTILQKLARKGRIEVVSDTGLTGRSEPALFTFPHMANWELALWPISWQHNRTCVLYEPRESGARMLIANRARQALGGTRIDLLSSRTPMVMRKIERALHNGHNLVLLCDEESGGRVHAPLLGRAPTYTGNRWLLARLAVKHRLDVVPLCVERIGSVRFKVHIEQKISPRPGTDRKADARRIADQVDAVFERWVRAHPQHWYWMSELNLPAQTVGQAS